MMEDSTIDGRRRTLALETWNVTWQDTGDMREKSTYSASDENPDWTLLEQRGTIECKRCPPVIGTLVEAFAQRLLEAGVRKGTGIFEELLAERAARSTKGGPSPVQGS
eukprot:Opistho-2@87804